MTSSKLEMISVHMQPKSTIEDSSTPAGYAWLTMVEYLKRLRGFVVCGGADVSNLLTD